MCPHTAKTHLYANEDILHPMSPLKLKYYNLNSSDEGFRSLTVIVTEEDWTQQVSKSKMFIYSTESSGEESRQEFGEW